MSRIACSVLCAPLKPNWELAKILFLEIYLTVKPFIHDFFKTSLEVRESKANQISLECL